MAAAAGSAVVALKSIGVAAGPGASVDRGLATFRHCSPVPGRVGSAKLRASIGFQCKSGSSFSSAGINFCSTLSFFVFCFLIVGGCIHVTNVSLLMVEFDANWRSSRPFVFGIAIECELRVVYVMNL